jgi:hypothetical protein
MAVAGRLVALAFAVVLVASHVAVVNAQPRASNRRAGPDSDKTSKALGRDTDPARLPPGSEEKVLPEGQQAGADALGRREDAFDASLDLVDDEVRGNQPVELVKMRSAATSVPSGTRSCSSPETNMHVHTPIEATQSSN